MRNNLLFATFFALCFGLGAGAGGANLVYCTEDVSSIGTTLWTDSGHYYATGWANILCVDNGDDCVMYYRCYMVDQHNGIKIYDTGMVEVDWLCGTSPVYVSGVKDLGLTTAHRDIYVDMRVYNHLQEQIDYSFYEYVY